MEHFPSSLKFSPPLFHKGIKKTNSEDADILSLKRRVLLINCDFRPLWNLEILVNFPERSLASRSPRIEHTIVLHVSYEESRCCLPQAQPVTYQAAKPFAKRKLRRGDRRLVAWKGDQCLPTGVPRISVAAI